MDMSDYYKQGGSDYRAGVHAQADSRILNLINSIEGLMSDSRILDIGCGDMHLAKALPKFHWVGLDLDATKAPGIISHDITKVPYPTRGELFDAVICSEVLEHLFDPISVIIEARGNLKEGGLFVVTTPNFDSIDNRQNAYKSMIFNPKNGHSVEHIRLYTPASMVSIVEPNRFKLVGYTGNSPHLSPTLQIARSELKAKSPTVPDVEIDQIIGDMLPFHCPGFMCIFKAVI